MAEKKFCPNCGKEAEAIDEKHVSCKVCDSIFRITKNEGATVTRTSLSKDLTEIKDRLAKLEADRQAAIDSGVPIDDDDDDDDESFLV